MGKIRVHGLVDDIHKESNFGIIEFVQFGRRSLKWFGYKCFHKPKINYIYVSKYLVYVIMKGYIMRKIGENVMANDMEKEPNEGTMRWVRFEI